jgi:hypothetical protein
VTIASTDADTILIRRAVPDVQAAIGIFDGLYEPGYLERLRADWRH